MRLAIPILAAGLAAASAHGAKAQAPSQTSPSSEATPKPASLALVESWPDGRVNYELTTTRRGAMWTPKFVPVEGFTPADGSPRVAAVQIVRWQVDAGIHVEVSVLLGTPQPPGVAVLNTDIGRGQQVVVEGLAAFGVKPITLSVADVRPLSPYLPTVTSVTPLVEVSDVRILSAPYPGYRITLRNLGTQAVTSARVQSYRGSDEALSSLQRDATGRPMMSPGESFAFNMNLTLGPADSLTMPGTWSPAPLDVIEIQEVRWANGTSDGVTRFPGIHETVSRDSGRKLQLRRIVGALETTLAEKSGQTGLLAAAKDRIESLPSEEPDQLDQAKTAMRMTKANVAADLARFERDQPMAPEADVRTWLGLLLRRYEMALIRMSPP